MNTDEASKSEVKFLIDSIEEDDYATFDQLLAKQEKDQLDAKDFGPYWLDGIQGTLAEERRKSRSNRDLLYNRQARKARRFLRRSNFSLQDFLLDPSQIDIKLSELWALYPSIEIKFQLSVQQIVRSNGRLLRGFLIYYYLIAYEKIPKYLIFEIEEQLDYLLFQEDFQINTQIQKECLVIRKLFLNLDKQSASEILKQQYSESNINKWITTQDTLWGMYQVLHIPLSRTKEKIQRRGYRESHSNKRKSKNEEGKVKMSTESRTIEEIKQSILRKQALLFEKRLDAYLALESSEITPAERKKIFISLIEEDKDNLQLKEEINSKLWKNQNSNETEGD